MKITCLLFSIYREKLGTTRLELDAAEGETAGQLFERLLKDRLPDQMALLPSTRLAVGQEYVDFDHPLKDGDELALIPPVAGG